MVGPNGKGILGVTIPSFSNAVRLLVDDRGLLVQICLLCDDPPSLFHDPRTQLGVVEEADDAGSQCLGIRLDVRHFAATPVGLGVTATAEVTKVEGRTIAFRVD